MLADPKSDALVSNFTGQWLQTRNLDVNRPDSDLFPEFTGELYADHPARAETLRRYAKRLPRDG